MSTTTLADGGRVETNFNYSTGYAEAQKYDAAGAKVGPVYQFATSDGYSVEPLSDGGYVIAVNQNIQYGHQLSGAAFNPSGVKTASLSTPGEFNIETADGGFLIVSRTVIGGHPPGDIVGDSVVKYYANDGTALGDAKVYASGQIPDASVNADGNFVVSWYDGGQTQTLTLDPQHPTDLTAPTTPAAYGVDDVGPVTGSFSSGTTDDATPTFRIPVSGVGHLGYALARNNYDPAVNFNVAVTAQDVARGYVEVTTPSALADGDYRFVARTEDATGVVSAYDHFNFTVAAGAPATLSISGPPAHAEGNSGVTDFTFTVTRSGDVSTAVAADYFLWTDQTDASDFAGAVGGTVRFVVGQTAAVIHVPVVGDTAVEGDETFHIGLSNARGGVIATGEAAGTILNDDSGSTGGGSTGGGSTGGGSTGGGSTGGSEAAGQVYTSPGPNTVETGGTGNDTFNASQGYDTLTGGGGNDVFVLGQEPWAPITVTDFAVGGDKLDLSALFRTAGYTGSDPVAAHYILLASDGAGGTIVRYDHDGGGPNPQWPNTIVDLQNVSPTGLTWAQLSVSGGTSTGGGSTGGGSTAGGSTGGTGGGSTGGTAGQVFTSPGPNSVETGTSGNDTFNASQGYDTLTGGGGADVFNLPSEPWAPIHITDFTHGADKIDLRALFQAAGYSGSDPVGDHYILVASDGNGGSIIRFDHDGGGPHPEWPNTIIDLEGVAPAQVSNSDWIMH